jgi:DNA-binding LacI/PurR family transcriptional regulator
MGERLNQIMRQALRAVTASVREIAEEAGVGRITLARYVTGAMGVSPKIARKVVKVLRRRGRRLLALAERLERALREEG